MQNRIVNRIESNLILNRIELNRSEFAKIVLESNQKPMNRESNRFTVYPKIHSPTVFTSLTVVNIWGEMKDFMAMN